MSSPGDLPDPRIEPWSPTLQADSLPLNHRGSPGHLFASYKCRILNIYWLMFIWCLHSFCFQQILCIWWVILASTLSFIYPCYLFFGWQNWIPFLKKLYNLHKVVSPYPWVLHPQIKLCLDFSMYLLNLGMQRVDIEIQLYCAILCKGLELPWVLVSMEVWAHPLQNT